MAKMIPFGAREILEPTPGQGNLVTAIKEELAARNVRPTQYQITAPEDFFLLPQQQYDCVLMNPPFSCKSANLKNAPLDLQKGMRVGYQILQECMERSRHIIALMPWFTLTDSDVRLRALHDFGLISVTALPRKTFEYARIQTVVLELSEGFKARTEFRVFERLNF